MDNTAVLLILRALIFFHVSVRRTGAWLLSMCPGSNHMYVFINPLKAEVSSELPDDITWEFAQKEIAQAKGFVAAGASSLSIGKN